MTHPPRLELLDKAEPQGRIPNVFLVCMYGGDESWWLHEADACDPHVLVGVEVTGKSFDARFDRRRWGVEGGAHGSQEVSRFVNESEPK